MVAVLGVVAVAEDRDRLAERGPDVVEVDPRGHHADDHLEGARLGHLDLLDLEGVLGLALALLADHPRRHRLGQRRPAPRRASTPRSRLRPRFSSGRGSAENAAESVRVRFASGPATTFVSPHGSIRETTATARRRSPRHRPRARRPARDRALTVNDERAATRRARARGGRPARAADGSRRDRDRRPRARPRGHRGRGRLRAGRVRAPGGGSCASGSARRSRPATSSSPSGSRRASTASATARFRRRSRSSSRARSIEQRDALLKLFSAEEGANPLFDFKDAMVKVYKEPAASASRPRARRTAKGSTS